MDKNRKTALVTGASAGLGAELSWLFARDGHDLVLVARRRDKLDVLAGEIEKKHGVKVLVLPSDLSLPDATPKLVAALEEKGVAIEYLVNNAGFGTNGAFSGLEVGRELEMIQLNITTLVHLTRLLLPAMLARKSGRILNLGSTAGFQPGPFMAGYYASKAFVNSFTEALWYELRGTGVTATVSCPGATATEFAAVAGLKESGLFKLGAMGAPEVAGDAYHAMMAGRRMVIHGWKNKLGVQSLRLSPRRVVLGLAASLNRVAPPPALPAGKPSL